MRFCFSKKNKGFTLVEVTIALGIISSSMLVLVGLLTTGLDSLRISSEQTTRAQILQNICEGLSVTRFSSLKTSTLYFSDEGLPVESASDARFKAEISPDAPSLPGISTAADINSLSNHLLRVNVAIARADRPNAVSTLHSLQVANQTGTAITP